MGIATQLQGIFFPDEPIYELDDLVGRAAELRRLFLLMSTSRSSMPVVVGPPGIGKTSLLHVAGDALTGNSSFVDGDLESCLPDAVNRLIVHLRCSAKVDGASAMSTLLLRQIDSALIAPPPRRNHLKGFELKCSTPFLTIKAQWEAVSLSVATDPTRELVSRLATLTSGSIGEVVIMLDECEQLLWLEDLLDYTREFAALPCRFILAIRDYATHRLANPVHGDYRWPSRIELHGLTRSFVETLLEGRAASMLHDRGVAWSVTSEAVTRVMDTSGGEPWYVQMIGAELLSDSQLRLEKLLTPGVGNKSIVRIKTDDIRRAEASVLASRLHNLHEEAYRRLTANAAKREELLRTLAHFPGSLIPKGFVRLIRRTRIPSANTILRGLLNEQPIPILVEHPRTPDYLDFADHQFRVYCRLRTPMFEGVDEFARDQVDAWRGE